jgi:putative transcriptional regulator
MKMPRKSLTKGSVKAAAQGFLDGQMLIATPTMQDERFARSVIYMCAHSSEGAMGIVVNQPAANVSFADLLVKLDVIPSDERIRLPRSAGDVTVLKGGPVETERGFVLHSAAFISSRPSRAATGLPARSWRSAMRAGRQASSRTSFRTTAGCIAPPTRS